MTDTIRRDDVVSRIALIIKRCYCTHSKWVRRISHYAPSEDRYGKFWTNAAILCITDRINPAEFIEVLFYATKPRWPEIKQIASPWAKALYHGHKEVHAQKYMVEFNLQLHGLTQLMEKGRELEDVLRDEAQEFDPLFIYATAVTNDLPDMAYEYMERALARYLISVHYDQIYSAIVPESFKAAARQLREGSDAPRVDGCASTTSD